MMLVRNFELRAESAYQQGHIGGFFHSYIGQEALQTAAVAALGKDNWWSTSYRCHALALLLGEPPDSLMAELYGKATGNAKGRGGSMHLYSKRMLGGFGIVGGQVPIGAGAAFALKYQGNQKELSICFLGDGAVAQGAFHEALNLASLWQLPALFVIENNQWGMGTAVNRAISIPRLAEDKAPGYGMKAFTVDGSDYLACFACFNQARQTILNEKTPVLIEAVMQRFKGHSISDPGLYRTKEQLQESMKKDPIHLLFEQLEERGVLDQEQFKTIDKQMRQQIIDAMKYADDSPWPSPASLESDVFAP